MSFLFNNVSMLLYIKDRFGISDAAWKELCSLCDDMPKLSNLKEFMRKLNSNWNIVSTPGDSE